MLSEKHHNPHRAGTEAYLGTERFNEGWNEALATVRKILGTSLAAAIHYPGCWDTAAYPTIESALAETGENFQCTNDDCPHHTAQQQSEPGAFDVAVSGYKVLLVRTRKEADDTATHFRGRGCDVEVHPLYGGAQPHLLAEQQPALIADPMTTGVGEYCQPGDRRNPRWILMFDDADRGFGIYENEPEARASFGRAEGAGWNCWLFSPTPRDTAIAAGIPAAFRWIPVTERLPQWDDSLMILAFTEGHDYGGQRFHCLRATDFYELDPDGDGEPGTDLARNVTHWMSEPWPPALTGAAVVPATLQFDNVALAAEIDWCLDEGHCGPRTRAVLQRIRDHQAAGITPARRPMLLITLRQAESLERFFGGHDAEVAVVPYKDGLLAWNIECPNEGSQWLGPTSVDDELAEKGRPDTSHPAIWKTTHPAVCVPITDSKAIADGWKEHGYDVVEFYPGPQEPRACAGVIGTAAPHADAECHTALRATPDAASVDAVEGHR
ncbi:DUF551 domain-containing protein [Ralstonia pseudosolanacearum]|uniref:DUF551 domain-containing protein n=1 Tax=Ralstonia pseudosolanacearum TaxID=1310165 RepID=UPI003CF37C9F